MRLSIKCVFLILVFTAGISAANAGKWGIGVNFSNSETQGFETRYRCFSCQTESADSAKGIYLSYNYNDAFGLELGTLDLGAFSSKGSTAFRELVSDGAGNFAVVRRNTGILIDSDVSANYIAGTATYQFSKKISATGRIGAASIKDKTLVVLPDLQQQGSRDDSSTEAIVGVSLDYNFNKSLKAGVRFNKVDVFYTLGLNLQLNF